MRAGLLAAATLPLMLFSGCTGSEVIDTGNAGFVVEVPVTNPEARFDVLSLMAVSQINIRPNAPDADASLGPLPIGVLATTDDIIDIDFSDPGATDPTTIVLSSGSYRIDKLQFANLILRSTLPPAWVECDEFFTWIFPVSILEFDADDLGNLANFTVPQGGAGALTIGIDATAFIEAYTNSFVCSPPPNPVPDFNQFDEDGFKALAPTYLTIQSTSIPG